MSRETAKLHLDTSRSTRSPPTPCGNTPNHHEPDQGRAGSPTPKITSYALLAVTPEEPHPNARVGCLAEDQGEWRSGRPGWGDNRAVRGEPDRQPVQTVESHVVRVILSWAGSDGGNTEAGRDENPGHT